MGHGVESAMVRESECSCRTDWSIPTWFCNKFDLTEWLLGPVVPIEDLGRNGVQNVSHHPL